MDLISLVLYILVGAFWGCTNPLLRKGASKVKSSTPSKEGSDKNQKEAKDDNDAQNEKSPFMVLRSSVVKFLNVQVWLPYALNQFGSILFYFLLARADLTLAVPICNALALIFSCFTSFLLGEQVDRPLRAILGSSLVMSGVAICILSREAEESTSIGAEVNVRPGTEEL